MLIVRDLAYKEVERSIADFLSNWNTYGDEWCTSNMDGPYVLRLTTTKGEFVALLPQIRVHWVSEDLASFTPASLPLISTTTAVLRVASTVVTSTGTSESTLSTEPKQPTQQSSLHSEKQPTSTHTSASSRTQNNRLSTEAKASLAIGITLIVVALLSFVAGFLILQRRRKRKARNHCQISQQTANVLNPPYVDSKAELVAHRNSRQTRMEVVELAQRDPQELAVQQEYHEASSSPARDRRGPPVPVASKPCVGSSVRCGSTYMYDRL